MTADRKKRILNGWEKMAIAVIVILSFIILALVFKERLGEYFRIYIDWYGNKN